MDNQNLRYAWREAPWALAIGVAATLAVYLGRDAAGTLPVSAEVVLAGMAAALVVLLRALFASPKP